MIKAYEYIYPTTNNQTEFIPVNNISGNVKVLVNGINLVSHTVQTITENNKQIKKLVLGSPVSLQDYLLLEIESNALLPIGNRSNVFIKTYGGSQKLMYNQIYDATLELNPDAPPINLRFTSRYDPFYCATKLVKEDIEHIVQLSDEAINWVIYNNSLKVLVTLKGTGDLTYDLPAPFELKDPQKIPFNVQQHVRYSAEYEILNAAYLAITGKAGRVSKKLGDMQIDKEVKIPFLNDFIRAVKEKLSEYPLTLANTTKVRTVIKGDGTEPWPITSPRRSF